MRSQTAAHAPAHRRLAYVQGARTIVAFSKRLAESPAFQRFVTMVILFAGVLVGIETYPHLHEKYLGPLHLLDQLVLEGSLKKRHGRPPSAITLTMISSVKTPPRS